MGSNNSKTSCNPLNTNLPLNVSNIGDIDVKRPYDIVDLNEVAQVVNVVKTVINFACLSSGKTEKKRICNYFSDEEQIQYLSAMVEYLDLAAFNNIDAKNQCQILVPLLSKLLLLPPGNILANKTIGLLETLLDNNNDSQKLFKKSFGDWNIQNHLIANNIYSPLFAAVK